MIVWRPAGPEAAPNLISQTCQCMHAIFDFDQALANLAGMSLEEKDFDPQQSNATALLMWHIVQVRNPGCSRVT